MNINNMTWCLPRSGGLQWIGMLVCYLFFAPSVWGEAGSELWSVAMGGNIGSSAAYDDKNNQLYVGSADNNLYALDRNGNTLWTFSTQGYIGAAPSISDDGSLVYVTSYDHHVYAVDALSGIEVWRFNTGDIVYSSVAVGTDDKVYVGGKSGVFYALSSSLGTEEWRFSVGGVIGSTAAIDMNGDVYVGAADGYLYSLDMDGSERWRFLTGGPVASPAIGFDGTIYVGSFDHSLYAINSNNGSERWNILLGGRVVSSPVIDYRGNVFVSSFDDGALNAVNSSGTLLWSFPLGDNAAMYSSPAIGDSGVVSVGSFDGTLYSLNPAAYSENNLSAMITWSFNVGSPIISSPLIDKAGVIYISAQNNRLHAIETESSGLAKSGWPMLGQSAARKGLQTDVDTDGDLLPDQWELAFGLDPNTADANSNDDGDGLTNLEEFIHGTNPNNADTDGDLIPDDWEVLYALDPNDRDDGDGDNDLDGLTNLQEFMFNSDPMLVDTDGDGSTDLDEFIANTNPRTPIGPFYANHSSQIACEKGDDGDTVWVVDEDNDSVSMVSITRNPITSEKVIETKNNYFIFTDSKPSSITRVNNYVATTYADTGRIRFNQIDFPWVEGGTVPWTTWMVALKNEMPIASVAYDNMLYVALYSSGEVIKIDTISRQIVSRLKVGPKPKAMALTSDGSRLLVTRFISTADYGEVYDINTAGNMSFRDEEQPSIRINKIWVPDDIDHGSGVANYLRSIVIDPKNEFAYVSANKANIERGEYLSGDPLSADNTIRSMIAVLDLSEHRDTNVDSLTREGTTDLQNAADPSGLTYLPDGDTSVYALQGSNRIELYNAGTDITISVPTGAAPQSLCVTEDSLYVKNHTDRTMSVIGIDDYIVTGNTNITSESVALVAPEDDVLSATELQGLQLFYSAAQTELSPEGYMSCASCHDGGGHDGMTWDFTQLGEGLRNTLSLRGTGGTRFGPLNWSANADEVQDIEKQLEQLHGSNGFIDGVTFTGQSPLNHMSAGSSTELDALSAYVSSLGKTSVMKSPSNCAWDDNECWSTYYSGSWQYYSHGCGDCHTRESHSSGAFRDGLVHEVGTITEASGLGSGVPLTGIRTPTLIELWDTVPYLHDGSAETLEDVMSTGAHATYGLDEREMRNLIQYLKNIDRSQYIGYD